MKSFCSLFIFLAAIGQATLLTGQSQTEAPLVAVWNDGSPEIIISPEEIQEALDELLSPSQLNFTVRSAEIVQMKEQFFLKITGTNFQRCLIALQASEGELREADSRITPFVLCMGCEAGCEPVYTEAGWYCSDGCGECEKTTTASTVYILE